MAYQQHLDESKSLNVRVAVVTLSDTRTPETDTSGQTIRKLLEADGHTVADYALLPDYPTDKLKSHLDNLLMSDVAAVITNGGTGIYRHDLAIPVVETFIDIPLPGFGELFRMLSYQQIGSGALASRATGGVARGKLLFALPGSTKAVELGMTTLILPELRHLIGQLRKK
jgi:molybdenum cofactor biosynthesis protein B